MSIGKWKSGSGGGGGGTGDDLDCDYYDVSSPSGSSTASGPIYIRPAGFDHHAHAFTTATVTTTTTTMTTTKTKYIEGHDDLAIEDYDHTILPSEEQDIKKKKIGFKAECESRHRKHRKDPLPMKQRALPQSFWQEPNAANPLSPGSAFSTLPPLSLESDELLSTSLSSNTSSSDSSSSSLSPQPHYQNYPRSSNYNGSSYDGTRDHSLSLANLTVTEANTDLLFSLFNSVEEEEEKRRIHVVKRGRPKKSTQVQNGHRSNMTHHHNHHHPDDDPCLNSAATESILPLIPDRNATGNYSANGSGSGNLGCNSTSGGGGGGCGGSSGTQVIKVISVSNGDSCLELPSINVEHNYSHLLSELVLKL